MIFYNKHYIIIISELKVGAINNRENTRLLFGVAQWPLVVKKNMWHIKKNLIAGVLSHEIYIVIFYILKKNVYWNYTFTKNIITSSEPVHTHIWKKFSDRLGVQVN